ncbi:MAG: 50S ribosomal protein L13 [Chloroflexi bacterium]|nr:50S ribosomal protein L13 [Chloroflexota bacterium]
MKTTNTKISDVKRQWHVMDASGKTLGRLCTEVARLLYGKHKAMFTPSMDTGDFVVIINASKVRVTGKKGDTKTYFSNSGYPGGQKSAKLGDMLQRRPEWVIEHAVKGMLPHNRLGRSMFRKLKVYAGPTHPHSAQVAAAHASEAAK